MLPWLLGTFLVASCQASAVEDRLPEIIAAMSGTSPAWLVDGSGGRWAGKDELVKSIWVLSRNASGSLRVQGRRLDAPGTLRFQDGMDGHATDVLTIADPWERSVKPGGASAEILRAYSFIPNYVIYPSRGCWELDVELGADRTRIVLNIR